PICPPNASISLTKCPFEVPPIDGLHASMAIDSRDVAKRAVLNPIRAATSPDSHPACPPPTTITSYSPAENFIIFYHPTFPNKNLKKSCLLYRLQQIHLL